ncbi:uncharacterized protein K444DRAFT_721015 [Hyaloscypha bicolor E]|uniref:DUF6594 domain-containing protein n=1 Tax=Hyaloscypha bicolor E TaxID=1095630 RepID=A0A2J6TCB2_9HELO|nr:uncharacterized protein K444DRAFT_721015 [Hyaloscypha bicolor E]PMD60665.1 hypothetical protein K444DRAFT_721015 [Hyaloscypha bicolor E]
MSSDNISIPAPAAKFPPYCLSSDEAERASPTILRKPDQGLLGYSMSSENFLEKGYLKRSISSFRSVLCGWWLFFVENLLFPFQKGSAWYKEYMTMREDEKAHIRALYSRCKENPICDYPPGWPQLAAFLHSDDDFAIFRRFGLTHCRVLVQLQAEIQLLEKKLAEIDQADAMAGSSNAWRLLTAEYEYGWDPAQRNLLKELQEKLLTYDTLLLNDRKLRELGQPSKKDYRSVLHWIIGSKPVGKGQYDWIFRANDFVTLCKIDPFEQSILSSYFRNLFRSQTHEDYNATVDPFSKTRESAVAKLLIVFFTVGILIIPIFLLLWIPLTRAWISVTVLLSVLTFSTLISLLTKATGNEVLVGTAAYCAVLASFLGNAQSNSR